MCSMLLFKMMDPSTRDAMIERGSLTTKPIPTSEVHALLRTLTHYMRMAVHLRADVFDGSESPFYLKMTNIYFE